IDFAYFEGDEVFGANPATTANWYLVAGQSLDALDSTPTIATTRVNYPGTPPKPVPAYAGFTASQMMGACGTGPAAGVENGTICARSTDVWGVALDNQGRFQVTWPVAPSGTFGCSVCNGTYVTTQTDGPTIAPVAGGQVPETPWVPTLILLSACAVAISLRTARRPERP
ncbi:MAG: hypothetical protein ACRDZY_00590, partial [Acidimicrobiales bacterium]